VKRKDVLVALLKGLIAGAETSALGKIVTTFIAELASMSEDKEEALDALPEEDFNELLMQSRMATINSASAAAGTEQIKEKIEELSRKFDEVINRDIRKSERLQIHNLPYKSIGGLFKGREVALGKLEEELGGGKVAAITQTRAICGLGGIGKTRLAVEFAWKGINKGRFRVVYFVRCGREDKAGGISGEKQKEVTAEDMTTAQGRFAAAMAELAGKDVMGLGMEGNKQVETAQAVMGELQQREGWLLILDNVDDRAMQECVRSVMGRLGRGKVIVTSRITEWREEEAGPIVIDKLGLKDSTRYLLERTEKRRAGSDNDEALAEQMAKELDGLPIALEWAAAYINRKRVGFDGYLAKYKKGRKDVLGFADGGIWVDYPKPVLSVWQTTEEQLSEGARMLLGVMSFLGPEAIPAELFIGRAGETGEDEGVDWQAGLVELGDWSMIRYEGGRVTVHRLIQEVTRLRLEKERYGKLCETAIGMVNDYTSIDPGPDDVRSWGYWEAMAGHVEMVVGYADGQAVAGPTGRLMSCLALFYEGQARYGEAEPLMRRALAIYEGSFGAGHPNVAAALNNLAGLLWATNRLDEAEPMYRRVVKILENPGGEPLPNYACSLNNLAALLYATKRLDEAEPLMRRALAIDEGSLGAGHPDVARDLNNLAGLLRATNRLDEAEPMYRRVVKIFEKSLGPEHPNVATAINNLAELLKATNRLAEVEPLMRRALEIDEGSFGPGHPNVAIRLNNLAGLLADTNRLDEAEPMYRQALAIDEGSFGPGHPRVATDLNNLAGLLAATKRLDEAEPLMRRVLVIFLEFTRRVGHRHPHLGDAIKNYRVLLTKMGYSEDEVMERLKGLGPEMFGSGEKEEDGFLPAQE
jgi:tetratricopeptide (TPR) repeat protein